MLQRKLAAAQAQPKVIRDRDVVYRSDRPLEEQPVDVEAASFEERLQRRERERLQQAGQRPAAPAPQQQRQQDAPPLWWRQQQEDRERLRRQRDM